MIDISVDWFLVKMCILTSGQMEKQKLFKIVFGILLLSAIVVFWYSIRYAEEDDQIMFTLIAFAIWLIATGINRWLKSNKSE
jgi:predicted membrane protein